MKEETVKLTTENIAFRAEILRTKLEEEGILCIISYDSPFGNLQGIQISVFKKDYDLARKIYEEVCENFSHIVEKSEGDIEKKF